MVPFFPLKGQNRIKMVLVPYICSRIQLSVFIAQILETAFKKETVGLVTREQYVEKVL